MLVENIALSFFADWRFIDAIQVTACSTTIELNNFGGTVDL